MLRKFLPAMLVLSLGIASAADQAKRVRLVKKDATKFFQLRDQIHNLDDNLRAINEQRKKASEELTAVITSASGGMKNAHYEVDDEGDVWFVEDAPVNTGK